MVLYPATFVDILASLDATECLVVVLDMLKTVKERIDDEATRVMVFIWSMSFKV